MDVIKYIRKKGVIGAFETVYKYKIDLCVQKILLLVLKHKRLQNIIVIESHNDFDSNGGAFYDYLIKNDYNQKYKIVWLLKYPKSKPNNLPFNVVCVPQYKPSIKKDYYLCIAKVLTYDQDITSKLRADQCSIYFTHGAAGLKDCRGVVFLPEDLNYCLVASDLFAHIDAKQYSLNKPKKNMVICGFPQHDRFYNNELGDLHKITKENFMKVILWMPTFRITCNNRKDSSLNYPLGVPLILSMEEYKQLDKRLHERNVLLIIKIHPKQDLKLLKIYDTDNIKVLTGDDMKKLDIENIRLMKDVDALISDYSSVAYDFLHVNKPIAYDFSDIENYTRGLIVDNYYDFIAGNEIRKLVDLYNFIDDIYEGKDEYKEKRKELFDKVFKYHDGNSCKRIVKLLQL